jgi:translation initiation factor RLI1
MRFRDEELTFKVVERDNENALTESYAAKDNKLIYHYPAMTKTLGAFSVSSSFQCNLEPSNHPRSL